MKTSVILRRKRIDDEKQIVLVEWKLNGVIHEFSTHAIYPKAYDNDGLHHGNYYDNIEDANNNFEVRN